MNERLCVHCVIYSFADDTLSLHTALSVLQTVHCVHTVCCGIYKREAWPSIGVSVLIVPEGTFSLHMIVTE